VERGRSKAERAFLKGKPAPCKGSSDDRTRTVPPKRRLHGQPYIPFPPALELEEGFATWVYLSV
jgi:hypothetical protein